MAGPIQVDDEALNKLKNAIQTAGENYKDNLTRLTKLIDEITSGDIQGEPADDLLAKYTDKQNIFKGLADTIDEACEYMGVQTVKFENMLDNLMSGMN